MWPYTVNISKQPKEEAAKEHNSLIKLRQADYYIAIYTDASVIKRGRGVGVGYCSYYSSLCPIALGYSKHSQNTTNLGQDQLVYNGELEGVTMAAEYASRVAYPGLHIDIFSDNQAGLWRLKTLSDNPGQSHQIRVRKAAKTAKHKGATIALNWVPGHIDVLGNELADLLAKSATANTPESDITSIAMLGLKIKALDNKEWRSLYLRHTRKSPTTYSKTYSCKAQSKI